MVEENERYDFIPLEFTETCSVTQNVIYSREFPYELEKNADSAVCCEIFYIYLLSLFDRMCTLKKFF